LTNGARLASFVGDDALLGEWAEQLAAVAIERSFGLWRAIGTVYRGWLKVKAGDPVEGISLLRDGLSAYRTTGAEAWVPYQIFLLARACEIAGQIEEAENLLDHADAVSQRTGERWLTAEIYRHKGLLLLRRGHSKAAEELYRKALGIAAEQEARLWALRAATNLVRLWGEQGRRLEAHDLLKPVFSWFTEGLDTPDLKEAATLLVELA
jgi:predicted ATPase